MKSLDVFVGKVKTFVGRVERFFFEDGEYWRARRIVETYDKTRTNKLGRQYLSPEIVDDALLEISLYEKGKTLSNSYQDSKKTA